jgi:hypothetical protein
MLLGARPPTAIRLAVPPPWLVDHELTCHFGPDEKSYRDSPELDPFWERFRNED